MSGLQPENGLPRQNAPRGRVVLRFVMRFVMVPLMLGFGAYIVVTGGVQGLVALLPILGAHVLGFLVIFPLWVRYRRRRVATSAAAADAGTRR